MEFSVQREGLLKALQSIVAISDKRHINKPIMSHALLSTPDDTFLLLTGFDGDVEIKMRVPMVDCRNMGDATLPARKLLDICRNLPDQAVIKFKTEEQRMVIRSERGRFTLSMQPATDFPVLPFTTHQFEISIKQSVLHTLISRTFFSVAQQDVRSFLNGLLFEMVDNTFCIVATDGHRLALSLAPMADNNKPVIQAKRDPEKLFDADEKNIEEKTQHLLTPRHPLHLIVPRKAVVELLKLLDQPDSQITLCVANHHLRVTHEQFIFGTQLIEGRFPEYKRVIPNRSCHTVTIDRDLFKQGILRAAVLAHEKNRGIRLQCIPGEVAVLKILSRNPEQEGSEEEIAADYQGEGIEVGFNANYLLDVLNVLPPGAVALHFLDTRSGVLIESYDGDIKNTYVVMPLRL